MSHRTRGYPLHQGDAGYNTRNRSPSLATAVPTAAGNAVCAPICVSVPSSLWRMERSLHGRSRCIAAWDIQVRAEQRRRPPLGKRRARKPKTATPSAPTATPHGAADPRSGACGITYNQTGASRPPPPTAIDAQPCTNAPRARARSPAHARAARPTPTTTAPKSSDPPKMRGATKSPCQVGHRTQGSVPGRKPT